MARSEIQPAMLTVNQAAAYLNCNKFIVRDLLSLGLIRYMKLGTTKIPVKELDRFIDESLGQDLDTLIKEKKGQTA